MAWYKYQTTKGTFYGTWSRSQFQKSHPGATIRGVTRLSADQAYTALKRAGYSDAKLAGWGLRSPAAAPAKAGVGAGITAAIKGVGKTVATAVQKVPKKKKAPTPGPATTVSRAITATGAKAAKAVQALPTTPTPATAISDAIAAAGAKVATGVKDIYTPPAAAPVTTAPMLNGAGVTAPAATTPAGKQGVGSSLEQLLADAQRAFDAAYGKWQASAPTFGFAPFDEALVRQQVTETSGLPEYYQRMLSQFLHQVPEKYGYYGARSGQAFREMGLGRQKFGEEKTEALETELYRRKQEEYEPKRATAWEQWRTTVHEPYLTGAPKVESYLYPAFSKYTK